MPPRMIIAAASPNSVDGMETGDAGASGSLALDAGEYYAGGPLAKAIAIDPHYGKPWSLFATSDMAGAHLAGRSTATVGPDRRARGAGGDCWR